ncbi:MAG TPA: CPBP family glutamic-type intramembrane protease [Anaerolineaceae bacterium]
MEARLDKRRVLIFILFAFGIAWAVALVVALTGGFENSPPLAPGSSITVAIVLVASIYMWAPALANILTRVITGEGFVNTWLRPKFRKGWPYWLLAWFLPVILTVLGGALFFLLFPDTFDRNMDAITLSMPAGLNMNKWAFFGLMTLQAVIISPLVNSIATFGEEFGWRGYLLQKLLPLGKRRALLLLGVIWGAWHWPLTAQGHNYGLEYAGFPWLGMLMMVWFTTGLGIIFSWMTLRGRSVWPAVIGHAAVNGIGGLALLLARGQPNMLLGPSPVGIIGGIFFTLFAAWILLSPKALPEQLSDRADEEI